MLLVLMMISWADKAILGIVAVPIMNDLGLTPQQFGLLGSAVFILFGVAQLVAAPIANRVKAKWILLVLCLIWSVAQVPIFVFASLPALWFSRLLLGAGEGPLAPISMHATYKWFPAAKGATPAAVTSSGVTLGIVAFAPVLAWVAAEFGWKATFIFLALIGALLAGAVAYGQQQQRILVQLLRKEPLSQPGHKDDPKTAAAHLIDAANEYPTETMRRRFQLQRRQAIGQHPAHFGQGHRTHCGHGPQIG